jgi:hypothetical protein
MNGRRRGGLCGRRPIYAEPVRPKAKPPGIFLAALLVVHISERTKQIRGRILDDLAEVLDDALNSLIVQLALAECEVGLYLALVVENDGDFRVLGHVIALGTRRVVDGKDRRLDALFIRKSLDRLVEPFLVAAEDDKAAHVLLAVLGGFGVNLLDQTGQGAGDFACEDHRDRVIAVHSDQAVFLARHRTGDIGRMERARNVLAHLRARLERVIRDDDGHSQHRHSEGSDSIPIAHRDTFLAEKSHMGGRTTTDYSVLDCPATAIIRFCWLSIIPDPEGSKPWPPRSFPTWIHFYSQRSRDDEPPLLKPPEASAVKQPAHFW